MNNLKFLSAVVVVALAASCASAPRQESYTIAARVSSNGVLLGEPSMLVEQGTTATVSVDGAGGYELEVNVRPSNADRDQALVDVELTTGDEEIASTLVVELGEPAMVSVDDVDLVLLVSLADDTGNRSTLRTGSRL